MSNSSGARSTPYAELLRTLLVLLALLIVLLACVLYVGVYHVLPYSPIRPHRVTDAEIRKKFDGRISPAEYDLLFEPLDIDGEDSVPLKAWFVHANISPM